MPHSMVKTFPLVETYDLPLSAPPSQVDPAGPAGVGLALGLGTEG
jgi:hypothetical protein